jgi:predicted GIY-YIG superfamily endonuclease
MNTVNDKIYIGSTSDSLDKRFKKHTDGINNHPILDKAMFDLGRINFFIDLIETREFANRSEMRKLKQKYINSLNPEYK